MEGDATLAAILSSVENQSTPIPELQFEPKEAVDCNRLALTRRLCDTAVTINRTNETKKNVAVCIQYSLFVFLSFPLLPKAVSLR